MSELRQRRPIVKRRRDLTRAERAYERECQERFKREVLRLDGRECVGATAFGTGHRCTGPLEAHHCVKEQLLRTHVSKMDWGENRISDFLWDPAIGATFCRALHRRQTTRIPDPVPLGWLPGRVIDFCEAWNLRRELEREHPSS